MKLNIFLVLAVAASAVSATHLDTNARRMARGFPPLPPVHRATPVAVAKRARPSGSHNVCNTGSLYCCNSVSTFDSDMATGLSNLLGIAVPVGIPIGLTCSPISLIGFGKSGCYQQTVCCDDNNYNGLGISIGCSPVDISL